MALTEFYVDPSIAADSGAGTIGDPYGDLEYCIEQEDWPAGPTRINILAGTDEVLAADLSTAMADTSAPAKTVAWTPTVGNPLIIQGYNSTAGDGGVGGISGGGLVSIMTGATFDGVFFIDMHLHSTGSNDILDLDDNCGAIHCEFDNTTGSGFVGDNNLTLINCYFHNIGTYGASAFYGTFAYNVFRNGTNKFTYGCIMTGAALCVFRKNIFDLDSTSGGIDSRNLALVEGNSVYSNGGTGTGIISNGAGLVMGITNNIIEGFSGTGGIGLSLADADMTILAAGGNSIYDCATEISTVSAEVLYEPIANESLSASPFTDAANGNFSPVDTGSVREGWWPSLFYEG